MSSSLGRGGRYGGLAGGRAGALGLALAEAEALALAEAEALALAEAVVLADAVAVAGDAALEVAGLAAVVLVVADASVSVSVVVPLPPNVNQAMAPPAARARTPPKIQPNGELFVGGLLLLAMGLVLRTAVKVARAQPAGGSGSSSHDESDFILVADQLATDVAQCLSSVMKISEEVSVLAQGQRDAMQRQSSDGSNTDRQETAIFTLAASIDKLNAHIDERVHGLDVQMRSRFDNIANAIHETRQALESHQVGGLAQTPRPLAAAPAPMAAPMAPAAPEPTIDFFENMEMANQPIASDFGSVPPAIDPNPPLPGALGGGGLDALLPDDSIQRALDQDQFPGLGQ